MILRIIFLIFLWLMIRRIWRSYVSSRSSAGSRGQYPGPDRKAGRDNGLGDITQQEITEAEFEELDDK